MAGRWLHAHLLDRGIHGYISRFPAAFPVGRALFVANKRGSLADLLAKENLDREAEMESALHQRDRIGVQDSVLLEKYESEDAFLENLQKRFKANLIYVSL